jgi:hypothetical protein
MSRTTTETYTKYSEKEFKPKRPKLDPRRLEFEDFEYSFNFTTPQDNLLPEETTSHLPMINLEDQFSPRHFARFKSSIPDTESTLSDSSSTSSLISLLEKSPSTSPESPKTPRKSKISTRDNTEGTPLTLRLQRAEKAASNLEDCDLDLEHLKTHTVTTSIAKKFHETSPVLERKMAKNNIKKLDDQIAYLAASSEKEDDYYYTTTPKTTRFFCGEIETSRYLKTYQQGSKVDFVRGISSYKKIKSQIQEITSTLELKDKGFAYAIREWMSGDFEGENVSLLNLKQKKILAKISVLLFIVEPSRDISATLIHQMFLDLIIAEKRTFSELEILPLTMKGAVSVIRSISDSIDMESISGLGRYDLSLTSVAHINEQKVKDFLSLKHNIVSEWLGIDNKDIETNLTQNVNKITLAAAQWYSITPPQIHIDKDILSQDYSEISSQSQTPIDQDILSQDYSEISSPPYSQDEGIESLGDLPN